MWAQLCNFAIGVWLMAAPAVLGYGSPAATNDRIIGPWIAALAGVAVGECTRNVRWWMAPFAIWLVVAPLFMAFPAQAIWNSVLCGLGVVGLASIRGRVSGKYGGGWIVLCRSKPRYELQ